MSAMVAGVPVADGQFLIGVGRIPDRSRSPMAV